MVIGYYNWRFGVAWVSRVNAGHPELLSFSLNLMSYGERREYEHPPELRNVPRPFEFGCRLSESRVGEHRRPAPLQSAIN